MQHSELTLPRNTDTPPPLLALFLITKEVTSTQKPGPSYGTAQPGKRESLSDRSIAADREGAGGEITSFLSSRTRGSLQLGLYWLPCYGPCSALQAASGSRTIFYFPEASAAPLLPAFNHLVASKPGSEEPGGQEGPAWL